MDNRKILDAIEAELADLQDALAGENPAMRLLINRWRTDLCLVSADNDQPWLKDELASVKFQLVAANTEIAALKQKLAATAASTYTSSEALKRMVRSEIDGLQAKGLLNDFLLAVNEKQWISAIKIYRSVFFGGLKESKDRVEAIGGM